jgi:hypothetical protein
MSYFLLFGVELFADFIACGRENFVNSLASPAPPVADLEITRTVSSPAIVPITLVSAPEIEALSKVDANSAAPPGGVRTTAMFPEDSIERISSENAFVVGVLEGVS